MDNRLWRWLLPTIVLLVLSVPASASAEHVTCGSVITQDTRLDSDLDCSTSTGLVIGAPGITLDLKGHSITGPGVNNALFGIRSSANDVHIKNGTVTGFNVGVSLVGSDASRIEKMNVRNTIVGISLDGSGDVVAGNRVTKNVITQSAQGINVSSGASNEISKNDGEGLETGILVLGGTANEITRNLLTKNIDGIVVTALGNEVATDAVVERNDVFENSGRGIEIRSNALRTLVAKNSAFNNGGLGIDAGSSPTTIDGGGNKAHGNGDPRQCTGVTCSL